MSENKKPFEEFDGDLILGLPDDDDELTYANDDGLYFMLPIEDDEEDNEELEEELLPEPQVKAKKKEKSKKTDDVKAQKKVKKQSDKVNKKKEKKKKESVGAKEIFDTILKILLICALATMLIVPVYNLTASEINEPVINGTFTVALCLALAIMIFFAVRGRLSLANPPKAFKGIPIALVTAGLIAMILWRFSGISF